MDNFELIIGDNASIDGTTEIVEKFSKKDKRINYIKNKTNIGMVKNFYKLLEKANGSWISFIGGHDVLYESTYLEKVLKCINEKPNASLIYPKSFFIDEDNNLTGINYSNIDSYNLSLPEGMIKVVKNLVKCGNINGFIKKSLYSEIPQEKIYGPDDLALFWLASKGPLVEVDCRGIISYKPRSTNTTKEKLIRWKSLGILENDEELDPTIQRRITGEMHLKYLWSDKTLSYSQKQHIENQFISIYNKRYFCNLKSYKPNK
jgi:glycosyltransferase involved in cell wall biosynthesis